MSNDISVYIDEAGTLSKNPKNPPYYIYAGYWCLDEHRTQIESSFGRRLVSFFPSCKNKEKKASTMKHRKKMLLMKDIVKNNSKIFHSIFVVEYLKILENPLKDKVSIQLHKHYLLRRFIEKSVREYKSIYGNTLNAITINIDDQSKTKIENLNYKAFPDYLEDYFKDRLHRQSFCKTDANIIVKYRDSNKYRAIQICDILANSKYEHYVHKRNEINKALKNIVLNTDIVKLPNIF